MLLEVRAFNEGARALLVWIALTQDEARHAPDDKARQAADDRLGLMTPVLKGVFTDTASPTRSRRSRCSAATAISPNGAWSSSCATRASP